MSPAANETERQAWLFSQVHPHSPMPHPAAVTPAVVPHPHLAAAAAPSPMLGSPVSNTTSTANAPCSTLFVANLGPLCSEQELKDLFARYYKPHFSHRPRPAGDPTWTHSPQTCTIVQTLGLFMWLMRTNTKLTKLAGFLPALFLRWRL